MTEQEYNRCVDEYADSVYRFILKNVRNEEDARDIVQTAFEKMWVTRSTVDGQRCKSFLFTVAYHQMIDHIRREKLRAKGPALSAAPVYDTHRAQIRQVIEAGLARLSETQRSLVLLKDYEGYSYEEIGQITGLNPSQVKVYLHRARLQLKNYLVSPENILEP